MEEKWWEGSVCYVCDYWWAILIAMFFILVTFFSRNTWLPVIGIMTSTPTPTSTSTPTVTPTATATITPSPMPTNTPTAIVLGTGDVQITLSWNSTNDLDLWVTDPDGEHISYRNRESSSSGRLDVDANAGCSDLVANPVENIFWPTGEAPIGDYIVKVNYYKNCESSLPISYKVIIKVDNSVSEYQNVIHNVRDTQIVAEFER